MVQRRQASGAAAVYATHDAAEALAVADRVALLRAGRIVQLGSPAEVYERPIDLWAARLTGPASTLQVEVGRAGADDADLVIAGATARVVSAGPGLQRGSAVALVRPGWAALGGPLPGTVTAVAYRGPHTDYRMATEAGEVEVRDSAPPRARLGDRVGWSLCRAWLLADGPASAAEVLDEPLGG